MITSFGKSHPGRQRPANEDSILLGDRLFVVCDGMGGHQAGEVASRLAIDAIAAAQRDHPGADGDRRGLEDAIHRANDAVRAAAASSPERKGMGTTVVAVLASDAGRRVCWATVGDSRLYRLRGDDLQQLSRDDSFAEAFFGDEPHDREALGRMGNALTKAVGQDDELRFAVHDEELDDGDLLLLCSDGLSNMVADDRLREILRGHRDDLEAAGESLLDAANEAGGRDNISVVLVQYRGQGPAPGPAATG